MRRPAMSAFPPLLEYERTQRARLGNIDRRYLVPRPALDCGSEFGQLGDIAVELVHTFSHSLVIGCDSQHYSARVIIQIRLRDCPTLLRTQSVLLPVHETVTHGT